MIVAIMQPYFFPYIGYFQLMRAVDVFVFYDNVQFRKGGWINRNRILIGNKPYWLTLPVKRDGLTKHINQRFYVLDKAVESAKSKLHSAYARTPIFTEIFPFICELLDFEDPNVAKFNINLLRRTAQLLGLRCRFMKSSDIVKASESSGESRVIGLCRALGADHYINAVGGINLYDPAAFADAGITLSFLQTAALPTSTESGLQYLSVIDGLMLGGFDGYRHLLSEYTLLGTEDIRTQA